MRGLDPRIHLLLRKKSLRRRMDCRVKPGNDSGVAICSICAAPSERNQQLYERTAGAISLFPIVIYNDFCNSHVSLASSAQILFTAIPRR